MLYYCLPLLMVISYGCDTTASEDLPAGTTEVTHTHEGARNTPTLWAVKISPLLESRCGRTSLSSIWSIRLFEQRFP